MLAVLVFLVAVALLAYALLTGAEVRVVRIVRTGLTSTLLFIWAVAPLFKALLAADRTWRNASGKISLEGVATHEGLTTNASGQPENWRSYLRLIREDNMVVLVGSDGLATVLPKRFFQSEKDWEDFVQYARYKVVEPR